MKKIITMILVFSIISSSITVSPIFVREAKAEISGAFLQKKIINVEECNSGLKDGVSMIIRSEHYEEGEGYYANCNDTDINEFTASQIDEWLNSDKNNEKTTLSNAVIGYDKYRSNYGKYQLGDGEYKDIKYMKEIAIVPTKIRDNNDYPLVYEGSEEGRWFKIEEKYPVILLLERIDNVLNYVGLYDDLRENNQLESDYYNKYTQVQLNLATIKSCNAFTKEYNVEGIYDTNKFCSNEKYIYASVNEDNTIKEIYGCYSFYREDELWASEEKSSVYTYLGGNANLSTVLNEAKYPSINYQWYKVALDDNDNTELKKPGIELSDILTQERLKRETKIEGATNKDLLIYNIKDENFGLYACEITDTNENRDVVTVSLQKIDIGDTKINKALWNSHAIESYITGVTNFTGELNRETLDVSTNLTKILPQNEYKYIWVRAIYYPKIYGTYYGWDLPELSKSTLDNYLNSDNANVTIVKDDVDYYRCDAGVTTLQCFAIPKEKYYKNAEIVEAINKISTSLDKYTAITELREIEKAYALELNINNNQNNDDDIELDVSKEAFLGMEWRDTPNFVSIECPLGFKNTEYKERIHLVGNSNLSSNIVQAKLGENLILNNKEIQTDYPLIYYWQFEHKKIKEEHNLNIPVFEIQDYDFSYGYTLLRCPHTPECQWGKCPIEKSARAYYNIINISDLSATGNIVEHNENNSVYLNVYAQSSSPFRAYKWYKRTVGSNDVELPGNTSTINITNPSNYTGKDISGSVSYVCKVSDGFKQEEVIFNIRDAQVFNVTEESQSVNTNAIFNYTGAKGTNLSLNPNVTVNVVDNVNNIVYEWYKNGEKLSTTSATLESIYPEEGVNVYEVKIKNSLDTTDKDTVSIKYILRTNWENNRIDISKDMSNNSSSNSGNSGGNSGSSGSGSNLGGSSGGSSGGGNNSSGGGSSSGDSSSEDKEDGKTDEKPSIDNEENIDKSDETVPSKDVVQSQPTQTSEKQIEKEKEQLIKDVEEGKVSDKVISEETVNNIKAAVKEGKEIITNIISETIKKEEISQTEVTKINSIAKKLSTKAKIAEYLNLEVQLKTEDKVLGNINELSKPIDFTLKIPDNLKAANRKYFVLRVHNGVVEKLDTVVNKDGTLTFKTDKFSTYALAYEDITKLAKVNSLKAVTSTKAVKLTWNKVKDATGYRVFIAKNGKWVKLADIASNSYFSNKFAAGTSLKFAVRAYYKSDILLSWADKYTSINTCTKPSKVTGFTSKVASKTAVATTWKKTSGATGYKVYIAKNGKWVQVATTKTNKYTFKGLKKNTKYKVAVKAYKTVGNKIVSADSYACINIKTKK